MTEDELKEILARNPELGIDDAEIAKRVGRLPEVALAGEFVADGFVVLPYPPSANRYWRNYGGRVVRSKEAVDYKAEVERLLSGKLRVISSPRPVKLSLRLYRPVKSRDLDNCIKILQDALQGLAFENDNQVVEIHATIEDDKSYPRAEVFAAPVGGVV
jgi:crossover junction endodeoxyribonuclease RusA